MPVREPRRELDGRFFEARGTAVDAVVLARFGYTRPSMTLPFLERHAREGLRASAEALFPANDYGAPDYRTTELVSRTLEYMGELPAPQRRLLVLLFSFVELSAPLLTFGFTRFSLLSLVRREAVVRGWRSSRVLPLRLLGDALKATLTMMYMSHPAALEYVGAYSTCERPDDAFRLPVRAGALREASEST